ncbi:TetR/AcrR family transcriptional regulator [Flavilitoribacter nigricans]|uniref:HTH tetR-type domain-containing protein n=1 Tax=Flavilitoribacter nigricans (strain ATCC 23147 / DSM 23189 / NBRC 102662 / NCIMB 1420 / SS-2) TaxID=1122177 RepID=A0A2D0N2E4_FLAN2|nr:TetR/AcrR family transcriptional regulator [Flavilitoribacter nigricans]PHN02299.1 hypothetical protein CRP01_32900 [Flavilitoribacter nigricans DSM 23189 = NBRC 102662]
MPKTTFLNLKEEKRLAITRAFLREFSNTSYDDASITTVVKELGIAKGSVYQYFEDKEDLFIYLIQVCSGVKMEYVGNVRRADYANYWDYFRVLFETGLQFDREHPLESGFLHNLAKSMDSPSVRHLFRQMQEDTFQYFVRTAEEEVAAGHFREDVPPHTMGFLLYKAGLAIQEQVQVMEKMDLETSKQEGRAIYHGKEELLLRTVDEYIQLLRKSFDRDDKR